MPRVSHFSTVYSRNAGASRTVRALHLAMLKKGWSSSVYCLQSSSQDPNVSFLSHPLLLKLSYLFDQLTVRQSKVRRGNQWSSSFFSCNFFHVAFRAWRSDLIVLYSVSKGLLSIFDISLLLLFRKPVIWRFSDMWPLTGGCHYSIGCSRFFSSCGSCPLLSSSSPLDISRISSSLKSLLWRYVHNLTIVCPSNYLYRLVCSSPLFVDATVIQIASGVNTRIFRPLDKSYARFVLDLPQDRFILYFSAEGGLNSHRKGGPFVLDFANYLDAAGLSSKYLILVSGSDAPHYLKADPSLFHHLGTLSDQVALALAYSAADIFLAPYIEDNLPNTVLEAISSGLPVLASPCSGLSDAVIEGLTGMFFQTGTCREALSIIEHLFQDKGLLARLSVSARTYAIRNFDLETQTQKYLNLASSLAAL